MSLGRCDRKGNEQEARDPDLVGISSKFDADFDFSFAVNTIIYVEVHSVGILWPDQNHFDVLTLRTLSGEGGPGVTGYCLVDGIRSLSGS